jgi:hypothetical protein
MSSLNKKQKIEQLTQDNYGTWKVLMQLVLEEKKLWVAADPSTKMEAVDNLGRRSCSLLMLIMLVSFKILKTVVRRGMLLLEFTKNLGFYRG